MNIKWSDEAIQEIQNRFGADTKVWKLVSDSEGCGCSVNGVPTLWAIHSPQNGELNAESNHFEVWYEQQHEVFFDDYMRITYQPDKRAFTLASDGQIYSNRLKLEDRRTAESVK
ncbi:iron-sulfur cluster biosynthesis family protein [Cohnella abietis]|uniref:Core domain-containing protein n=1 Tax=Cohnella abietis TaxID=2507935 RepID=A0A3T1D6C6_9BACL|nr:iron-sulfur cluster biosynthesis family protein [Cohnella abietis]BBI33621.1 hypothetical protein KCTCHS21_30200 [Cohnella abietis]